MDSRKVLGKLPEGFIETRDEYGILIIKNSEGETYHWRGGFCSKSNALELRSTIPGAVLIALHDCYGKQYWDIWSPVEVIR